MPEIGTMQQINSEPLRAATVLTPQSQAEQYAREAQQAAAEAAQSATDAQTAAESAQQAATGAVKYSEAQTLTATQQAQARENIGAVDTAALAIKQDAPAIAGTEGQVLTIDDQGDPIWATPTDAVSRQEFDALAEDVTDLESALNKLQLQITPQIIPNKYIENGAFVTYNTWSATDYIEVTDNVEEIIITTERASVYNAWYDNTKTYMSEESLTLSRGTNVLTRPTGARYFALSNTTEAMSSTSVFFKVSVKNYVEDQIAESKNYTDSEVETVRETIPTSAQNQQYYNLLENHRDSLVVDQFVLDNGELWPNDNYISLSDYIECEPNTDYGFAFTDQIDNNPVPRIAWYKSDKTHIETIYHANNTAYTSPSNARFFRISCTKLKESQPYGHSDFSLAYFAKCDIPYGPPAIDMEHVFNDKYPNSSLKGKKWVVFGDSITEKNVRSTVNYHDYIRSETGINVINQGVGGAGYKCRWQNGNNMFALANAYDFAGVDIVTCMAGINDSWSDLTTNMGNADDVYDTDSTAENQSVMACFNHFLDIVISKAPFAKIGIISPIPCWHTQSGTDYHFTPDDNTSALAVFIEKCKTACKNRGIPYLDLFHTSGLRPWDSTVNAAMFKCNASDSPDGLHPNYLGHKYFYPLVREFVKQLG